MKINLFSNRASKRNYMLAAMKKIFQKTYSMPNTDRLSKENNDLRKRLRSFVTQANENQSKLLRFKSLEIEIIRFDSLGNLLKLLTDKYSNIFSLDIVTLALVDSDGEFRATLNEEGVDATNLDRIVFLENDNYFTSLFKDDVTPYIGQISNEIRKVLFPGFGGNPSSVALIPLIRHNRCIGSLNLRSYDQTRFIAGNASDFLEHFGDVASVCLENSILFGKVKRLSTTDPLTGVKNRRFLNERLPGVLSNAIGNGDPVTFLLLDIDKFKSVNDIHGHSTGDGVLKRVSETISTTIEPSCLFSRFGGEEFAIVFTGKSLAESQSIAETIRKNIEEEKITTESGESICVTVSIGVKMLMPKKDGDVMQYIQHMFTSADKAMYRAKANGRNKVVVDT